MRVNQINVTNDMKISDLVDQFDKSGVLGAGRVGRACNVLTDMIMDEDMKVFMSLGGPLIPGGMRNIVTQMIRNNHVDLIVSSGANITHDLLEAFGGSHYRHEGRDDEELNEENIIPPALDRRVAPAVAAAVVRAAKETGVARF